MALKMIIMIAITMALTLVLTTTNLGNTNESKPAVSKASERDEIISKFPALRDLNLVKPPKRVSRFLAEQKERNPRAADHCHKDNEICYVLNGQNSTCCNNKCMDLSTDSNNCGACKNKCKFTESCCGGECVNLAYDKRHCGICSNKCKARGRDRGRDRAAVCLYGMCDYA